jgi:transposase
LPALRHATPQIPAGYVCLFANRNKTDARDAAPGCEAVQRPGKRFVPVKSVER